MKLTDDRKWYIADAVHFLLTFSSTGMLFIAMCFFMVAASPYYEGIPNFIMGCIFLTISIVIISFTPNNILETQEKKARAYLHEMFNV